MPDHTLPTPSSQSVVAGDSSSNYQAARDININQTTAPKPSSIVTPTNAQIAKFDENVRKILDAIKLDHLSNNMNYSSQRQGLPWLTGIFALLLIGGMLKYIIDYLDPIK